MTEIRKTLQSKVSRRGLLKTTGIGTAAAAVGGLGRDGPLDPRRLAPVAAAQVSEWDEEADIVVVGSGAAASAAAVTAHEQGASVVILEKAATYGGTSAKSGGTYWIPNNSQMREAGMEDPREAAIQLMARVSYPHLYHPDQENLGLPELKYRLIETYYDTAAETIDELANMGALNSITNLERPGYHAHLPENQAPRGRHMGPETPEGERGSGAEMIRQLRESLDDRGVGVRLEHRAERVVQDEDGRVVGVQATTADGETVSVGANQGVIFGNGGFTHNPDMRINFLRGPIYGGCAVPTSEGDFVHIGGSAGSALGNMQHAWWAQIVFEQALELPAVPNNVWQTPGDSVIQVNRFGHRVMNEKMQYNERTQIHFNWNPVRAEYTNLLLFMIYDQRTADEFAGFYPVPSADADVGYVISGETLEELTANVRERLDDLAEHTRNLQLDDDFAANFDATLSQFNEYARQGADRQYHRGEVPFEEDFHSLYGPAPEHEFPNQMMYPISEEGPYYCIILCAGTLDTKGGPVINERAQVLNTWGDPIPGLYGAGNCIASPAGQAYWSAGGTLGPALTFGYIAGMSAVTDGGEAEEPTETPTTTPTPTPTPTQEPEETPTPSNGQAQEHTVEMTDALVFEPEDLTVSVGETVTWVTVGAVPHTATCDPEQAIDPENSVQLPDGAETWNSGTVSQGEEFSHTFEVPGEYTYFCIPHESQGMIGHILVEER